jgi:hypothetical protein
MGIEVKTPAGRFAVRGLQSTVSDLETAQITDPFALLSLIFFGVANVAQ